MFDEAVRHLTTLGLKPGATFDEVRRNFRALARQWHPDRFHGDATRAAEATERFRRINEAVKWLRENPAYWSSTKPGSGAGTNRDDGRSMGAAPGASGVPATRASYDGARQQHCYAPNPPQGGTSARREDATSKNRRFHIDVRALAGSLIIMLALAYTSIGMKSGDWSPEGILEGIAYRIAMVKIDAKPAGDVRHDIESGAPPRQYPAPPPLGMTEGIDLEGHRLVFVERSRQRWGSFWVIAQEATLQLGRDRRTWQRTKVVNSDGITLIAFVGLDHTFSIVDDRPSSSFVLTIDTRHERSDCCGAGLASVPKEEPIQVLNLGLSRTDVFDKDVDGLPEETRTMLFREEGNFENYQLVRVLAEDALEVGNRNGELTIGPVCLRSDSCESFGVKN